LWTQHVVAEVIGRLPDEFDLGRRNFERLEEGGFLLAGGVTIYEMRALAGLEWKDEDVTAVGGYVIRRLGHLPLVDEQLRIDGYIITVEQADDRRVQQLSFRIFRD
jgi:CBS domain containing-hemolysin-like protein